VDDRNVSDPAVAIDIGAELGLDREEFSAAIAAPAVKDALKENTERAIEAGAFGVPTFFVGEEMFWGQDRLDFVRREVERVLGDSR
jgi:2-hydroxychromene-2-carboxylate isomerase